MGSMFHERVFNFKKSVDEDTKVIVNWISCNILYYSQTRSTARLCDRHLLPNLSNGQVKFIIEKIDGTTSAHYVATSWRTLW